MAYRNAIPQILTLAVIPAAMFGPRIEVGQIGFQPVPLRPEDALLAAIVIWTVAFGRARLRQMPKTWLVGFSAFMAAIASASILGNPMSGLISLAYGIKLVEYAVFGAVASVWLKDAKAAKALILTVLATASALGLWLSFPVFGDGWNAARAVLPYDERGTQQSSLVGAWFLMSGIATLFFIRNRSIPITAITVTAMVASMWLMLGSGGRAGILGAGLSTVMLLVMLPRHMALRAGLAVVGLMAAGLLGVMILAHTSGWDFAAERLQKSASIANLAEDRSLNTRSSNWTDYWAMFNERKALGHGMPVAKWADNWFLRLLMETGIVGFSMWMVMSAMIVAHLRRARSEALDSGDQWRVTLVHFGVAVIACMVVASMFADQFLATRIAPTFWVITGAVIGQARSDLRRRFDVRTLTSALTTSGSRTRAQA